MEQFVVNGVFRGVGGRKTLHSRAAPSLILTRIPEDDDPYVGSSGQLVCYVRRPPSPRFYVDPQQVCPLSIEEAVVGAGIEFRK